jgi:hypothetical protein
MPILYNRDLLIFDELQITKLRMPQLIKLERLLWTWMDKTGGAANIAKLLNIIHREVEWRAMETDWH